MRNFSQVLSALAKEQAEFESLASPDPEHHPNEKFNKIYSYNKNDIL
jgi:hypothetical protein